MVVIPRRARLSFDDFCKLIRDGQKADLINGAIYMSSPDNTDANRISGWLFTVMKLLALRQDAGEVFVSRVAFRLDEENGPEPDIAFVRKDQLHRVERGFVQGPPDLAVEIVSPESIERDYEAKRQQYETAGVTEYWILDEVQQKVTVLRLGRDRKYHEVRRAKGWLVSQVFPKFRILPEWLWQRPEPDPGEIVSQLLAPESK
jgi:Uma2 family endonuclease